MRVVLLGSWARGLGAHHVKVWDTQPRGATTRVRARIGTLDGVSVTHQSVTCPGPLEEERPGAGTCARGEACEVLELQTDYLAYRSAHIRVISLWRTRRPDAADDSP